MTMIHYTMSVIHTCDACSTKQTVSGSADGAPPYLPVLPPDWKRVRMAIADSAGIIEEFITEYCAKCHPVIDA